MHTISMIEKRKTFNCIQERKRNHKKKRKLKKFHRHSCEENFKQKIYVQGGTWKAIFKEFVLGFQKLMDFCFNFDFSLSLMEMEIFAKFKNLTKSMFKILTK